MTQPNNSLLHVIEQAIHNTSEGISIADATQPNMPLVYVNPAFYQVTGYSAAETIGYNCRFLQGPNTSPEAVATIRAAIRARERCTVELLNYRKDRTMFWNRLSLAPIFENGTLTHYVGIQSDITTEKEVARAREQLVAMRTTMSTVNDVVRNFMTNAEYFRTLLEDLNIYDPAVMAEYETSINETLDKLTILSTAQAYREREVARGIMGIDLERLHDDRPTITEPTNR